MGDGGLDGGTVASCDETGAASVEGGSSRACEGTPASRSEFQFRAQVHASIGEIPCEIWDGMLAGDPESYAFYRAIEPDPPPGFTLGAISVRAGDRIVAVAPLFRVAYRLDTPLQGRLRRVTDWLHARWPGLLSLSVIGIGSPMSDNCTVGFAPDLGRPERQAAFSAMLDGLQEHARARRISLLAVKSLDRLADEFGDSLAAHRYLRATTVPLAMLPLPHLTFDAWLESLPKKERIYFRKKMKSGDALRIEYRTSIAGLETEIMALFLSTLAQSRVDYGEFDKLATNYFRNVVDQLGDGMQMMLCWQGDVLVSFQLCLIGRDRVVNKQLGMRYPQARELNLFFVNWLLLVRWAIEHGVTLIEMGATTYGTKLLFGGYVERRWLYFRSRSTLATTLMRPFVKLFDFELNDPELRNLAGRIVDSPPRAH